MTGAGSSTGMSRAGTQLAPRPVNDATPGRSPLAHLLHALNQPLTGLQCSNELAVAGPRSPEEYVRTLRESLQLIERLRILVEAIREITDFLFPEQEVVEVLQFDALLRETAADLLPVAAAGSVRLMLLCDTSMTVRSDRRGMATLIFRLLASALSLSREESSLRILASPEPGRLRLVVSWEPGCVPEHSPFSRQELGLLVARAGFERAGGEWSSRQEHTIQTCTVRLPLATPSDCSLAALS